MIFNNHAPDMTLERLNIITQFANEGLKAEFQSATDSKHQWVEIAYKDSEVYLYFYGCYTKKYLKKISKSEYEIDVQKIKEDLLKKQAEYEEENKKETIAKFRFPLICAYVEQVFTDNNKKFKRVDQTELYASWEINKEYVSLTCSSYDDIINKDFEDTELALCLLGRYFSVPLKKYLKMKDNKSIIKELKLIETEFDKQAKIINEKIQKLYNEENKVMSERDKQMNKIIRNYIRKIKV